jgi:LCP family protein required for cell wall assembly
MSRLEKIIFSVLVLIAAVLWIDLGWNFYRDTWQAPLGPGLFLPTQRVSQTGSRITSTPPVSTTLQFKFAAPNLPNSEPAASVNKPPLCNGPTTMTVLAIGSDTRAPGYLYGLADVIRYVRIDFVTPRISVMEFPRDLWVEIPDIEDHYGITHGKLNQAYFYGNPGMGYYQGLGEGPGLLARTLDLNFGARPDHYIAANMQTFVRLVNTVGGIDVYLPYSVDARKPDQEKRKDLYFEPGHHHLSGEQALMLGRIREFGGFSRADQQNRILCALRDAIISPSIFPKLPEVIDTFSGAVQTDLSLEQLSQLACLVPNLKPADINFTTFPRELLTESRTYDIGVKKDVYIFKADFNTLKLYVKAFELGVWPELKQPEPTNETPRPRGEGRFSCP